MEKLVSRVAGDSSLAGCLLYAIVGSDNSSATNGSSVASVAGKNRFPAIPCAKAASAVATHASAATTPYGDRFRLVMISSPLLRGTRRDFIDRHCSADRENVNVHARRRLPFPQPRPIPRPRRRFET